MDKTFTSYKIEERSYVSFLKRQIHLEAAPLFSERQLGEIDIIVSEITSNLIKHAGSGEILYRIGAMDPTTSLFEIVCLDQGPGIEDTTRMLKDGISTTKTLGNGLGAMNRLSSFFQIYSLRGWGTIVFSRVIESKEKPDKKGSPPSTLEIKGLCVSKPRESVCGDGYKVKSTASGIQIFFADGLGHGPHAKDAVDQAGDFFLQSKEEDPVDIIREIHEKVRKTRGMVGSLAVLDKKAGQWKLVGVGNILTRMYSGIEYKNHMPYNGTIGLNIPNSMKASVVPMERNQHLIMCSDGIKTRWELNRYPSILKFDNTVLAAALYKDYSRRTDDASVLVAKVN